MASGLFVPDPDQPIDPRYVLTVAELHDTLTQAFPSLTWQVQAQAQEDGSCMIGAAREHAGAWWGFAAEVTPCRDGCRVDHDSDPEWRQAVVHRVAHHLVRDIIAMN